MADPEHSGILSRDQFEAACNFAGVFLNADVFIINIFNIFIRKYLHLFHALELMKKLTEFTMKNSIVS